MGSEGERWEETLDSDRDLKRLFLVEREGRWGRKKEGVVDGCSCDAAGLS